MTGSAADTPTTPEFFRISDVDRERAVDELKQEFVHGRLSHDTFLLRMQAALGARNDGELSGLFTDLPPHPGRLARMRAVVRGWSQQGRESLAGGSTAIAGIARSLVPRQHEPLYREPGPGREPRLVREPGPEPPPRPLRFPPGPDTSFTIGRDHRCDLYIDDMTVSRLHARLAHAEDGWSLSDLGSTNGTRLNGWRVRAAVPVRPGDLILFGSVAFVVQSEPSPSG
ncbi:MAG TPA: DUF1707 and FHA domain-containing protein [Streptosporangiaceae bacterium]|nr:DUF1707 and FHA domain-containing protein [Streptosporangiaceae bacterium]